MQQRPRAYAVIRPLRYGNDRRPATAQTERIAFFNHFVNSANDFRYCVEINKPRRYGQVTTGF